MGVGSNNRRELSKEPVWEFQELSSSWALRPCHRFWASPMGIIASEGTPGLQSEGEMGSEFHSGQMQIKLSRDRKTG
jgi:hypothetical protein